MSTIYIGKMHRADGQCERDDFDAIFPAKSEAQLIEDVKSHMADWCDNLELLEERDKIMAVKSIDELTDWFDNDFASFSFEMETFNV